MLSLTRFTLRLSSITAQGHPRAVPSGDRDRMSKQTRVLGSRGPDAIKEGGRLHLLPSAAGVWHEVSTEGPWKPQEEEGGRGHLGQRTSQTPARRAFSASQGPGSNLLDGAPEGGRVPSRGSLSAGKAGSLPLLADHIVGAGSRPHIPTKAQSLPNPAEEHWQVSLLLGAAAGAKACLPQADGETNEQPRQALNRPPN